ncbi:MAG: hypothetical protein E7K68_01155, partial [Corynebacterium kroppenstedtii]|nr:hypothetical protein [Corynebacterium kroppenstedtii]
MHHRDNVRQYSPHAHKSRHVRKLSHSRFISAAIVTLSIPLASVAVANGAPSDSPQPDIPASSQPNAMCVPYLGDISKGNGQFPLGLVAPDFGDDGYDALPVANDKGLPERIDLRDNHQGFHEKIDVALHEGSLVVRHRGEEQWRHLPTPDCLDGNIVSMSINGDSLIALDKDGWMYTLSNLLSSPTR